LTVPVKSGAEGRLFGTVRAEDVAKAVQASGLGSIDKRRVELTQRIKTTGVYQAVVRLHEEVNANVEFEVVPA
jgi:large subunit ribosomal protein L9